MMIRSLILMLSLCATPDWLVAQEWASKAACTLPDTAVTNQLLTDEWLDQQEKAVENGVGKFWRLTAPNGAVSHLWGTMHSTHRDILDVPPQLRDAIAAADVVASEFDPVLKTRAAVQQSRKGTGYWLDQILTPDPDFLRPDVDQWVRARLLALGYSEDWYGHFTLGGLGALLLGHPCDDFAAGVLPIQDNYVLQLGIAAGARTAGLEPYDAFLTHMNQIENRDTAIAVIKVYASYLNPQLYKAPDGSWLGLYLRGHIAGMMAWDQSNVKAFYGAIEGGRLHDLVSGYLLKDRNLGFVASAVPLLESGNAVLAVGAGHLPGKTGLVRLFRDAGYQVERIPVRGEVGFIGGF